LDELRLTPCLTPHGRLLLAPSDEGPELEPALAGRLRQAFARGAGHGLLRLGAAELGQVLPPVFAYWRELGSRHVTALCTRPDVEERRAEAPRPSAADLEALASAAPMMPGAEYLTAEVLSALWVAIGEAFTAEQAESGATVQEFLKRLNPAWNVVGRVHFNLAENRKDEEAPFAFLATYTSRLSAPSRGTTARPSTSPSAGRSASTRGRPNKERLLALLLPVQRAAERCPGSSRWSRGASLERWKNAWGQAARARESGQRADVGRAAPGMPRAVIDLLDQARNRDLRFHVEASFILYVG
jgi:hypothetical protein